MEREVESVSRELNFSEKLGNKRETLDLVFHDLQEYAFKKKKSRRYIQKMFKFTSNQKWNWNNLELKWEFSLLKMLKHTHKAHTQTECWRKGLFVLILICFGTALLRGNMTSAKKINNLHDPNLHF